ncbi:hypothetical protein SADUNF_Sadunf16G0098100 [Salix dunnii]|uniref:Uncharacterized protein n=1 Tax=Salix dunnii TaxID=1413687 RepID=A0A835J7X3_9ROSI|nr:hypothetical protein SADUNF_Sadunf16G0098100 [Salix dunnii]
MARFQVIAVAILVAIMLLSIGMSTALPKPIQGLSLRDSSFPAFHVFVINMAFWRRKEAFPVYSSSGLLCWDEPSTRREMNAVADSSAKQGLCRMSWLSYCFGKLCFGISFPL